jgi:hypothetical protein
LAALTPQDLFNQILAACTRSSLVEAYTIRTLDPDILSMRVHLVDGSFVEVFFNATTYRTAFALIVSGQRIYGKDNAKMGWHVHPLNDPQSHLPCSSVSFEEFLAEIEAIHFPAR